MKNMNTLALTVWDKKIFKVFFFLLQWQPQFFVEFKSLKYSDSASPRDHFCEVSLKSVGRFQRRRFFFLSNCSRTGGLTPGNDHSQCAQMSLKGHNSERNAFELSPLIEWIALWTANSYSVFHVNIVCNNRDILNVFNVFLNLKRGIILKQEDHDSPISLT